MVLDCIWPRASLSLFGKSWVRLFESWKNVFVLLAGLGTVFQALFIYSPGTRHAMRLFTLFCSILCLDYVSWWRLLKCLKPCVTAQGKLLLETFSAEIKMVGWLEVHQTFKLLFQKFVWMVGRQISALEEFLWNFSSLRVFLEKQNELKRK